GVGQAARALFGPREGEGGGGAMASGGGGGRPPPAFGRRPRLRGGYLRCDLAGELVLDVGADDLIEARLRPEAERPRALRLEPLRPAADDPGDRRIGLAANAGRDRVAGDSRTAPAPLG